MHRLQSLGNFLVFGCTQMMVDALLEGFHVLIDVGLIDLAISISDVINEVSDKNVVESFIRIVKFSVVYGFDGISDEVDSDAAYVL